VTRQKWKNKIKKACVEAGTYHKSFQTAIDTLAGILETRDKAEEKYIAAGSEPIVKHTNKAGATNIVKNPALVVVSDCNVQALAYMRDLGLTAKGLKSLGVDVEKKEDNSLEGILSDLGI
jgi:ABC-type enterochelin transport system substrate-binding protein